MWPSTYPCFLEKSAESSLFFWDVSAEVEAVTGTGCVPDEVAIAANLFGVAMPFGDQGKHLFTVRFGFTKVSDASIELSSVEEMISP